MATELVLKFENEVEAETAATFLVDNYKGTLGSSVNHVERVGDSIFFTTQVEAETVEAETEPEAEVEAEAEVVEEEEEEEAEVDLGMEPTTAGEDVTESVPVPLPEIDESNTTPELPADEFEFEPSELPANEVVDEPMPMQDEPVPIQADPKETLRDHLEDIVEEAEEALKNLPDEGVINN